MTDHTKGTGDVEPDLAPDEEALLFAALRSLGDPRPGEELDDAAMIARVLAATKGAEAPAPVVNLSSLAVPRRKTKSALRRGVAMAIAGFAIAATVAYAAQRIFLAGPAPMPPEAPAPSGTATVHHGTPGPAHVPAPADTATSSDQAPPVPSASAAAEAPAPAPAPSATAAPPTADEMLERAQSLYTAGDTAGAGAAYRALVARYPGSAEARAALISLGQLSLRGGRADEALGHFDRYLAGGGPLAIEARVGRIAALRQLGRTADERAAIDDFLARHGDSVHAVRLRARLAEISAP